MTFDLLCYTVVTMLYAQCITVVLQIELPTIKYLEILNPNR